MNESIAFVQNWLVDGETIVQYADEVFWNFKSCYPIQYDLTGEGTPSGRGSIALTNKRLILIEQQQIPRWYSVTGIASLSERPPKYSKDRQGRDYPYQAQLTFYSGVILVLETLKDRVEERGKALSILLANALVQLNSAQPANHLFREYIQQYEEERRRQDQDYTRKQDRDK